MNNRKHYAAGIAAFLIWGFFPIPLKAIQDYSAGQILYFRILFSLLVLVLVIIGFKRGDLKTEWTKFKSLSRDQRSVVLWLTLAGGALLTVNWLSFIYVVNNVNVRTASFAYLLCPVITAILGYALIKEKLTPLQWIAVTLCALSCVLMGISSGRELGFSFLTAFTYALFLISQRKNQGFDRLIMLGIQTLFSFLILSTFSSYLIDAIPDVPRFYINIIVIAVLFTVLPLFLNLFALNRINSATIGILMYLNPIINFTVAFVVFNETVNGIQVIGYSIIVAGLILFNLQNFRKIQSAVAAK